MFGFTYHVGRHGWANASLLLSGVQHAVSVSYLCDPLTDLARSAAGLLSPPLLRGTWDSVNGKVVFGGEPDALILRIGELPDGEFSPARYASRNHASGFLLPDLDVRRLELRLTFTSDWMVEDVIEEPVDSCECGLREFAVEVERALGEVYRKCGVFGYRERWEFADFPLVEWAHLRRALGLPAELSPS